MPRLYTLQTSMPSLLARVIPVLRRRWPLMAGVLLLSAVGVAMFWSGVAFFGKSFTNRLSGELSLYLLQHAHNPVDWYPWGPEALEQARREHKPIFLSIGYSTCYWCHVMERRVFSDPAIAALMNAHFINIKVDREERPDLDEWFMTATQLLSGQGGWPNSVFLTPDLDPFYAGTYFPPADGPGRPGFPGILNALNASWQTRRDEVTAHAAKVTGAIRALQDTAYASEDTAALDPAIAETAIARLKTRYDGQHGGFGGAPKFPPVPELELLLAHYRKSGDPAILKIVTGTLDAMMAGGLYDHIGGGFHRYTVDTRWRIPHFEKMLYIQADLARVYLQAYQVTRREPYRQIAEETLTFVEREMRSSGGGFYSAIDAETDGIEGRYYLWTEPEVREALGTDAAFFLGRFGLAPMIEGDGQALYLRPAEEDSLTAPAPDEQAAERLATMKTRLAGVRSRRKAPAVDTKIITAWNARMIGAYACAASVTGNRRYRDMAESGMDFLLKTMRQDDGSLRRIYRAGMTRQNGFQEDYAQAIRAALFLYEATSDPRWLVEARKLADRMIQTFWDERRGGFFFTDGAEEGLVRAKYPYDGAQPSGNAAAALTLIDLAGYTGDAAYRDRAYRTLRAFAGALRDEPGRFTSMMLAVMRFEG